MLFEAEDFGFDFGGSEAKMHYTSSFPGYYFARDLIPGVVAIPLPRLNSEITWRAETSHNVPLHQPSTDRYVGYDKEVMRQAILNHEFTFRSQVHELHRLYRRQTELMSEFKWRYIQMQTSQSNPITSTIQYEISQKTLNVPGREVLKATGSDLSLLCAEQFQEPLVSIHHRWRDFNPCAKKSSPKFRDKILDLELPADQYLDSEEGEKTVEENVAKVPQIQRNPPKESLKFLIDLNEPLQLDESEIPLSFSREDNTTCCTETNDDNQNLSQRLYKVSKDSNGKAAYTIQATQEIDVCSKISDLQNSQVELPNHNSEAGLDGATLIPAKHVSSAGLSPVSHAETTRSRTNISEEVHNLHVKVETKKFGSCISSAHQLVPQSVEPKIKSLSSVSSQRRSVHVFGELPFTVQALPTPKLFKKSLKSVFCSSKVNSDLFNKIEDAVNALEGPVSPENKECSPPRGESDDMQLEIPRTLVKEDEHPIGEIEKVAAEAIISISSSAVQRGALNMAQEPRSDCLEWFAGVVSSMDGNLDDLFSESTDHKEEETAESSLPRQQGRGRKPKQQRAAKKKAVHSLGALSRAEAVGFNKSTKRKRTMGENDFTKRMTHCCALEKFIHSPSIWRVEDKHIGKCLGGWGSSKGRRRIRRGRIGFLDFPLLAHGC